MSDSLYVEDASLSLSAVVSIYVQLFYTTFTPAPALTAFADVHMLKECLYSDSVALSRFLEREQLLALEPLGLTPTQALALQLVLDTPGQIPVRFAEELCVTASTVSRVLDSLYKKGLVDRRQRQDDAREWSIFPTEAGEILAPSIDMAFLTVSRSLNETAGPDLIRSASIKMRELRKALSDKALAERRALGK